MPSISVDIDLDDFGLDELLAEIGARVNRAARSCAHTTDFRVTKHKMDELEEVRDATIEWMDVIKKSNIALTQSSSGVNTVCGGSLYDNLKMEHLLAVIDQYTLDEIESKLPKK